MSMKILIISQLLLLNLFSQSQAFFKIDRQNFQGIQCLGGLDLYMPIVTLNTQQSDNQIIIKVIDNGLGISLKSKQL